jgi:hypothetical protein
MAAVSRLAVLSRMRRREQEPAPSAQVPFTAAGFPGYPVPRD